MPSGRRVKCSACKKEVDDWTVNGYGRCGECERRIYQSKSFQRGPDIYPGDRVKITMRGQAYFGRVISAAFWGEHDGWYIEVDRESPNPGYGYWKQGCDSGTVELLSRAEGACAAAKETLGYLGDGCRDSKGFVPVPACRGQHVARSKSKKKCPYGVNKRTGKCLKHPRRK